MPFFTVQLLQQKSQVSEFPDSLFGAFIGSDFLIDNNVFDLLVWVGSVVFQLGYWRRHYWCLGLAIGVGLSYWVESCSVRMEFL